TLHPTHHERACLVDLRRAPAGSTVSSRSATDSPCASPPPSASAPKEFVAEFGKLAEFLHSIIMSSLAEPIAETVGNLVKPGRRGRKQKRSLLEGVPRQAKGARL